MIAKRMFYVSASMLLLAATYQIGTRNAGAAGALPQATEVATLSGVLHDGEIIPLPTYADGTAAREAECHWFAGLQTFLVQYSGQVTCATTGRVVHVSSQGGQNGPVLASFMIIATRGASSPTAARSRTFGALKAEYR